MGAKKENWTVHIPKRLDELAQRASEEAANTTKSEFIRAAVKKLIRTLEPLPKDKIDFGDTIWHVTVPPLLNDQIEKAIETGSFTNKAEFIRAAVRRQIKVVLPRSKL